MNMLEELGVRPCEGEVGIEIELEGKDLPEEGGGLWRGERDGSLRGAAVELVLNAPVPRQEVPAALKQVTKMLKANDARVVDTVRAGIHVHINIQDLTPIELAKFITLYLTFEEILVNFCGKERVGNLFCLRCQDAPYLLDVLVDGFREHDFSLFGTDEVRYASMNLKAIVQYGSLEFRAMRSTIVMPAIEKWVAILLRLKDLSKKYATPIEIVEQCSIQGTEQFFIEVLGPFEGKDIVFDGMSMMRGVRNAQHLAYGVPDWEAPVAKISDRFVFEAVDAEMGIEDKLKAAERACVTVVCHNHNVFYHTKPVSPNDGVDEFGVRWLSQQRVRLLENRLREGRYINTSDMRCLRGFVEQHMMEEIAERWPNYHDVDYGFLQEWRDTYVNRLDRHVAGMAAPVKVKRAFLNKGEL